jgi:hypothetical protein
MKFRMQALSRGRRDKFVYTAPKKNSIAIARRVERSRRASEASIRRLRRCDTRESSGRRGERGLRIGWARIVESLEKQGVSASRRIRARRSMRFCRALLGRARRQSFLLRANER